MKYSLILIILFFSCNSIDDVKKFNFYGELFKGNIELITETSYEPILSDGELVPGMKIGNIYSIKFVNDTIIEKTTFDLSEKAIDKSKYIFNKQNSLLKSYIFYLDGIGQLSYEGFYDKSDNKIEEKIYTYGNELMMINNFDYDVNNRIIRAKSKSFSYYPAGYWKYQYDSKGNVLSEDYYINESNFLRNSDKYEYDNKSRIIKNISINNHRGESLTNFYKYNDKDDLIYRKSIYSDSTIIVNTFEYKFDEKGNWIEKHYYKNNVPSRIDIRAIIYQAS